MVHAEISSKTLDSRMAGIFSLLHLAIFPVNCPLQLGFRSPKGDTLKGPVSLTVEESSVIHSQIAEDRGKKNPKVKC